MWPAALSGGWHYKSSAELGFEEFRVFPKLTIPMWFETAQERVPSRHTLNTCRGGTRRLNESRSKRHNQDRTGRHHNGSSETLVNVLLLEVAMSEHDGDDS